ncbi:MAG: glycosyltransferase family 4 protein [Deltaproteobacteria bacterium]|nr:glycosyltransferase family 4 protein [Deltaproteobacteria bacterium]
MRRGKNRVVLDAREFLRGKFTGIGRVLEGIVDALAESDFLEEVVLAAYNADALPKKLQNRKGIRVEALPQQFIRSERALSRLCKKDRQIFISPYPKLPLFGCHCLAVHTVHDVLDLTHPAYERRFKTHFDKLRLRKALKRADLTWYDSLWSMEETKKLTGSSGRNPRIRYLGIDERFTPEKDKNEEYVLKKHDLEPGYVLVIGNGLPHKNLGVLLKVSNDLFRKLAFVGVSKRNQVHWRKAYPNGKAQWIQYVGEDDLPPIIRCAFCLAQPSTAEGYGYPPLEAMACGVPTVVSNIPVLIETTGGNALVADTDDPRMWMEAFQALENKDVYTSQIENGLKWVDPFRGPKGWEKHISDIEEQIEGG